VKSFVEADTEFILVREEQPVGHGGLTAERPTGEVKCAECGRMSDNVDEIPHAQDCSQRGVHSHWYVESFIDN